MTKIWHNFDQNLTPFLDPQSLNKTYYVPNGVWGTGYFSVVATDFPRKILRPVVVSSMQGVPDICGRSDTKFIRFVNSSLPISNILTLLIMILT